MAKTLDQFEAEQSEQVKELKSQLLEKDRILETYKKEHGRLQVFFDSLLPLVSAMEPVPIVYKPDSKTSNVEIESVFQSNDWHIGEVQDADEIERINAFNYKIATDRVVGLGHRINRVIDRSRNSYVIKNGVLICNGDMISGDIHNELERTNEFPVPVQVVKAAELFSQHVIALAQNFNHFRVEYITADNHSRLTKKPQAKEQGINSFNYLVAILAEKILSRQINVEFNIHTEPQKVVDVYGRKYLVMHGHQIRGWAGIPWYGVERKASKESQSRLSMIMDEPDRLENLGFHKIIAAHLHTPIDTLYYSVCGSLSGTNAYDRENGRYSPPSQGMWFVSAKHGEFGRIDFSL